MKFTKEEFANEFMSQIYPIISDVTILSEDEVRGRLDAQYDAIESEVWDYRYLPDDIDDMTLDYIIDFYKKQGALGICYLLIIEESVLDSSDEIYRIGGIREYIKEIELGELPKDYALCISLDCLSESENKSMFSGYINEYRDSFIKGKYESGIDSCIFLIGKDGDSYIFV